jgi:succinate dehydrogenase/fumarate reductase flavoprotein subunit
MPEYDVVVVGAGPAGMSAAIAAAERGAAVALVDALDRVGGNAVLSTGYLAFVDVDHQREHGIVDSAETFLADAAHQFAMHRDKAGMIWDEELTWLFARESAETYRRLVDLGLEFSRLIPRPQQNSVDRLLATDPAQIGRIHERRLAELGVEILLSTHVATLVVEDGRVVGVRATARDENVELRARRGVVLACGGYQGNRELRRRYQPARDIDDHVVGVPTCRGSGHVLGASVGGDLINMGYLQPMILVASLVVEEAIAVNTQGRRFHDEAGPYGDRVAALARQPDQKAWYVVDGRTLEHHRDLMDRMPEDVVVRDSVEELGNTLGCDVGAPADTVKEWNAFLRGDEPVDPSFGRVVLPDERRVLAEAPFAAAPMIRGTTFTWGGLVVTRDMQVVTVLGDVVPGLFAAGDTIGGLNVVSSVGGLHISGALTLGRIAGAAAVSGPTADPHLASPAPGESTMTSTGLRMPLDDIR